MLGGAASYGTAEAGVPLLIDKFVRSLATRFDAAQCALIGAACADQARLEALSVPDFMAQWVPA